jgi:hypothetical protein
MQLANEFSFATIYKGEDSFRRSELLPREIDGSLTGEKKTRGAEWLNLAVFLSWS